MVRISIFYPNTTGGRFDTDYYINKHMPMSIEKQGTALKGVSVELGLTEEFPGTQTSYIAMCHLLYDSVEAFQLAFAPHAEVLTKDMINYTNIEPVIQVSEVKIYL
ncbi:MAG TPA: EthD family reductase [Chitinophagaceae bacterium]|nr:EthD family reductase [Chitinophagaceae bacterium]